MLSSRRPSADRAAAAAGAPPPAPPGGRDRRRRRRRARGRGRPGQSAPAAAGGTDRDRPTGARRIARRARGGHGQPRAGRSRASRRRGQLDQRVGDVGVAAPFGGGVARQRAPAGPLGRGEAAGDPQRDGALVGGDGDGQAAFGAFGVGMREGWLPPVRVIVAWASKMSSPSSSGSAAILRAGGDSDLGDGLRPRGPQVPARGLRRRRQLRPPARGLSDLRRRNVDRHAGDAGGQPRASTPSR